MDEGTLELLRCLQSGPYDESSWKQIRGLLRTQRRTLRAQQDSSTPGDLVQLLESWAEASQDPHSASEALREAADIAERELTNPELASDLRKRAVTASHAGDAPRGGTNPHAALAQRRVAAGDLDGAIEAYERALNVEPDTEIVGHLARLYAQRGTEGDAQQAADLFYTLADVLGHPAGIPSLEQALDLVPDHAQARALLTEYNARNAPPPEPEPPRPSVQRTLVGAATVPVQPPLVRGAKSPPPLRKSGGLRPKLRPGTKAPMISMMNKSAPAAAAAVDLGTAPVSEAHLAIELTGASEPPPTANMPGPESLSPVVVDEARALERSRERLQQTRARKRKITVATLGGASALALAVVLFAPRTLKDMQHIASPAPAPATSTTTTQPATQPPPAAPEAPVVPEPPKPAAVAPSEPAPAEPASEPAPKPAAPVPSVALGRDQFELRGGKWSDVQLMAAIEKLQPKLDECYATALEKRPRLKGKLGVSWTVKTSGKATAVKKQGASTIKDAELVRCTLDAIGSTRYPRPRKRALSIKLPLEFHKTAG